MAAPFVERWQRGPRSALAVLSRRANPINQKRPPDGWYRQTEFFDQSYWIDLPCGLLRNLNGCAICRTVAAWPAKRFGCPLQTGQPHKPKKATRWAHHENILRYRTGLTRIAFGLFSPCGFLRNLNGCAIYRTVTLSRRANPINQKRPPDGWPFLVYMVGRTGFEPVTNWLKANCSTN